MTAMSTRVALVTGGSSGIGEQTAIGLIFGIYTTWVGIIACIHLLVAAAAVWKVTGGKWLWNIGGYEYCVFWAICCLVVAMHG